MLSIFSANTSPHAFPQHGPPYLIGEIAALSESDTIVTESVSRPMQEDELFNYAEERTEELSAGFELPPFELPLGVVGHVRERLAA